MLPQSGELVARSDQLLDEGQQKGVGVRLDWRLSPGLSLAQREMARKQIEGLEAVVVGLRKGAVPQYRLFDEQGRQIGIVTVWP